MSRLKKISALLFLGLANGLSATPNVASLNNVTVTAGAAPSTLWTASATGVVGTPSYQWRRNGFNVAGATAAAFQLGANARRTDADYYDVVVTDSADSSKAASNLARLSVAPSAYPGAVMRDTAWDAMTEFVGGTGNVIAPIPLSGPGSAVAPGGFYVGGSFTTVNGTSQTMLMRVLASGALDTSFVPPVLDSTVLALAVQADGKLIVGGNFYRVNGSLGRFLFRSNTNGSVDATFAPALNGGVNAIITQADGQIIVGGAFTTINGVVQNRIARLNTNATLNDGSIDFSFSSGAGFNNNVNALALDASGKLLVGGFFTTYSAANSSVGQLVRLHTAGAVAGWLDTSFSNGTGFSSNSSVNAIAVQSDGNILIGGSFTTYNGSAAVRLARVSPAGVLESTFSTNLALNSSSFNSTVNAIVVLPDTTILVGGVFAANGNVRANLTHLAANGTADALTATPAPPAPNGSVSAIALQANAVPASALILVGGNFNSVSFAGSGATATTTAASGSVTGATVTAGGTLYASPPIVTFSGGGGSGASATATLTSGAVTSVTVTSGGTGYTTAPTATFTPSVPRTTIMRLNSDMTLDQSSLILTRTTNSTVATILPLPGNQVLVGGGFSFVRGAPVSGNLVRFNTADGSLDTTFNPGLTVYKITVTNGGTGYTSAPTVTITGGGGSGATATATVLSGAVTGVTITAAGTGFAGAPTVSFGGPGSLAAATASVGATVKSIAVTNPGSGYKDVGGNSVAPAVTLSAPAAGGTQALATATVVNGMITAITVNNAGSGYALAPTLTIGAPASGGTQATAVLNAGGNGPNNQVTASTLLPDGRIAIGGSFTSVNGATRNRVAVISGVDGTLDTTTIGTGAVIGNNQVFTMNVLPPTAIGGSPRLFLAGSFTLVNTVTQNRVAIINLDATGTSDSAFTAAGTGADAQVSASVVQPDGKIVIGGSFLNYAGTARADIARILQTGALDTSFITSGTAFNSQVLSLGLLFTPGANTSQIVAGGQFSAFNGATQNLVARFTTAGAIDTTFAPPFSNTMGGILPQEDGGILARGVFFNVSGQPGTTTLARFGAAAGARDATFSAAGFSSIQTNFSPLVMLDDGRLLTANFGTGLALASPAAAPSISTPPVAATAAVGAAAQFSVTASGLAPLSYQWYFNGAPISGGTNATLAIATAALANVGSYTVVVSNELGSVQSNTVTLSGTGAAPTISVQPVGATVAAGAGTNVNLSVTATGTVTGYQWSRNGVPISGATSATYTITGAKQVDSDMYSVVVANGLSTTQSNFAKVVVTPTTTPNGLKPDPAYAGLALDTNAVGTGVVRAVLPIPAVSGGGFYVAGDFTKFGSSARSRVAKFTAAGALDTGFVPPSFDGVARALAFDSTGKLLVGGSFSFVNGLPRSRLVRLDAASGALDTTFNAFVGTDNNGTQPQVNALAVQSDGKILAGGGFTSITGGSSTGNNGFSRPALVRLNTDGTPDFAYDAKVIGNTLVSALLIIPGSSDKLAVGGFFTGIGGATLNNFAVLTNAGVADPGFNASGTGPNGVVSALALDGSSLVLGGSFASYNGTANVNRIARVSAATGALDTTTFNSATGVGTTSAGGANGAVSTIVTLSGSTGYLIGGAFTSFNGTSRTGLAKLGSNGALDLTFNPGTVSIGTTTATAVNALALEGASGANVIVGGDFNTIGTTARARLARLTDTTTGTVDSAFNPDTLSAAAAFAIAPQPGSGGKYLVLTNATRLNGSTIPAGLIRVDGNGAYDATYNSGGVGLSFAGAGGNYRLVVLPDGGAYVSGNFSSYNGVRRNFIARVTPSGALDTAFNPGAGPSSAPNAMISLPNGQLLVGGAFGTFNGTTRNGLVRLNSDGSIDNTLLAPPSAITINALALAGTAGSPSAFDKFYVGGTFTGTFSSATGTANWNNTIVNRLARLNPDGTLDSTFAVIGSVAAGASGAVNAIALQTDGKVLLGGSFTNITGVVRVGYARLNPDGSVDRTYGTTFSNASATTGVAPQTNGSAIIKGTFGFVNFTQTVVPGFDTAYVGSVRNLARLTSTGNLDGNFGVYGMTNFSLDDYVVLDDGRVLTAGQTPTVDFGGTTRAGLTMLVAQTGLALAERPRDRTVFAGQPSTSFSAETHNASGTLSYQWRRNGVALTPNARYQGIYARVLTFNNPQSADAGSYDCVITDSGGGSVTSLPATLTVIAVAPTVSTPTVDSTLDGFVTTTTVLNGATAPSYTFPEGLPVVLNGSASGTEPMTYQWQFGGSDIAGATRLNYDVGVLTSAKAGNYTLKVSNSVSGSTGVVSSTATINLASATVPTFVRMPNQATTTLGTPAYFNVIAGGPGPITYQWQRKTGTASTFTDIVGATKAELLIGSVTAADAGLYRAIATNGSGVATSAEATLALANSSVWTWRHATPTGATYQKVAFGAGRYVATTSMGDIFTSTDSINWTIAQRFPSMTMGELAFGNGKFVIGTTLGAVLTSSDGLTWSISNINAANPAPVLNLFSLIFDGTRFVGVAGAPGVLDNIITSTDGVTWTSVGAPTPAYPQPASKFGGIAVIGFGNNTYIGGESSGEPVLYTSTNLTTWTPHTIPTTFGRFLNAVTFSGGVFYAVGDSNLFLRSTDNGATWSVGDIDSSNAGTSWNTVAAIGGKLVASNTSGGMATSLDGLKWTLASGVPVDLARGGFVNQVAALNNQFVAVGSGGIILTSPGTDGVTWTERFARPLGLGNFNGAAYGTPGYVAVGNFGQIGFSTSGTTWTAVDTQTRTAFAGVTFAAGKYVAVGNTGLTSTSTDGINWTNVSLGGNNFVAVGYVGTTFVAVGANRFATSPDGVVWTDGTPPTSATLRAVAANGNILVAGGDGVLFRTTDGVNWTTPTSPVASNDVIRSIAVANGQFLTIVGGNALKSNYALTSPDGLTWTSTAIPHSMGPRAIVYGNGRYTAVGGSGIVLTSTDGASWNADTASISGTQQALAVGPSGYVAAGSAGAILTAPNAPAPIVASITPTQFGSGTSVAITGTGFTGATGVSFGGSAASSFTINSDTSITATTAGTPPATIPSGAVIVTGPGGTSIPTATFTAFTTPAFTTQPVNITINDGQTATFTAAASGNPAPTFQWKKKLGSATTFTNIAGATSATLSFTALPSDSGIYAVDITNSVTTVQSNAVTLTVNALPPANVAINSTFGRGLPAGTTTLLSLPSNLSGSQPLTYQWKLNGTNIPGATASTFAIRNAKPSDSGAYSVAVTNSVTTTTSADYALSVAAEHGWEWRNALPMGTVYTTGAFVNNQFFVTGTRGTMLTSPDGAIWTRRYVPTAGNLFGVAFGNNIYVTVGALGMVYTSPDAITWTPRASNIAPETVFLTGSSLVFGAGRFVFVGSNAWSTSTDGINWTAGTFPTTDSVDGISFVNGKFYAAATNSTSTAGSILSSTDGSTWTQVATIPAKMQEVAFGATRYVAVGGGGAIYTSTDGLAWSATTSGTTENLLRVIFANSQFIATGTAGGVYVSADGLAWTPKTSGITTALDGIAFANGTYLLVGQGSASQFRTSTDLITTVGRVSNAANLQDLRGATVDGTGTLVAVGTSGTIVSSTNGSTWTLRTSGTTNQLNDVSFGSSTLVAVGLGGKILTSPDGTTWTTQTSGTTADLNGVKFANNQFVAVGSAGVTLTSPTGVTWTSRTTGTAQQFLKTAFGAGVQVSVGFSGIIYTSADAGVTWVSRTSGVTATLSDVIFANGQFVVVGAGLALTSPDGVTWTRRLTTTDPLNSVIFAGGNYLATSGASPTYYSSPDGITWTARFTGSQAQWNDMAVTSTQVYAFGDFGVIQTAGVPVINLPASQPIALGTNTSLAPMVSGAATATTYQWQKRIPGSVFANVAGATSPTLAFTNLAFADSGDYQLVATNSFGSTTSGVVSLTTAPFFSVQPTATGQILVAGQPLAISTTVVGGPTPTLQWTKDGVNLAGATGQSLAIAATQVSDSGVYRNFASNSQGSATSASNIVSVTAAGGDAFPSFAQRNPSPAGGTWRSVAYAAGTINKFVAVGQGGRINASADGTTWTLVNTASQNLTAVAFSSPLNLLIAVGTAGDIYTSADATTWTKRTSGTTDFLNSVTVGGSLIVATSNSGRFLTSSDGLTWATTATSATIYNAVAGTSGLFVAVGNNGLIANSTNGTTWNTVAVPSGFATQTLANVRFVNGQFVAVGGSGTLLTSTDGATWAQVTTGQGAFKRDITYLAPNYIISTDNGDLIASTNISTNSTWTYVDLQTFSALFSVAASPTAVVTVGTGGEMWSSPSGATAASWTARGSVGSLWRFGSVEFLNNQFIAVGSAGAVYTSADASAWTRWPTASGNWAQSVAFGAGVYVVPSQFGDIMSSPNAQTWTNATVGDNVSNNGVAFGNGKFIVVGNSGKIRSSANGTTWANVTVAGLTANLQSIVARGSLFVTVGDSGTIYTSADGVTWTSRTSGTTQRLWRVRVIDGTFFAMGDNRTLLISNDGIAWTALPTTITNGFTYRDLARLSDGFYLVGDQGILLKSADLKTWTSVSTFPSLDTSNALAVGAGKAVVVGEGGNLFASTLPVTTATPVIAVNPAPVTTDATKGLLLSVVANSSGAMSYQWSKNGTAITGATSSIYFVPSSATTDSGTYTVAVTNGANTTASTGVLVTINAFATPAITAMPIVAQVVTGTASMSVTATGTAPLSYQWYRGLSGDTSTPVSTNPTFSTPALTASERYWVRVTNVAGGTTNTLNSQTTTALAFTPRNPPLTLNTINGLAFGNSMFVGVGFGNVIVSSPDGTTWTRRAGINGTSLRGVAYGAGTANRFVAVGDGGTITTSTDGITWATTTSGATQQLNAVTFDGTRFVAVGLNSTVLTSTNGTTWTAQNLGTASISLRAVMWFGGVYLAVGDAGAIFTSSDAVTWVNRPSGITGNLLSVACNGSKFIATGASGVIRVSSDAGATWSGATSGSTNFLNAAMAVGSTFYVSTGNQYITSTDGVTWATPVSFVTGGPNVVALLNANSLFLAAGFPGVIISSPSGASNSWTQRQGVTAAGLSDVVYGNGRFVTVGTSGVVATSSDGGASWTALNPAVSSVTASMRRVTYAKGLYVAVGDSGRIWMSGNAQSWSSLPVGSTNYAGVVYAAGKFIAAGSGGGNASSADGFNWTAGTAIGAGNIGGLDTNGSIIVAVDNLGGIYTSTNGTAWTARTSGTTSALNNVVYLNGRFIATGANSTVLVSTDGIAWAARNVGVTGLNFADAAYGDGMYLLTQLSAASNNTTIYVSTDTVTWNSTVPGGSMTYQGANTTGITFGNGTFVFVAGSGIISQTVPAADVPRIAAQPIGQAVTNGQQVTLTVTAAGTGTGLGYQWYEGLSGDITAPVGGATTASFLTPPLVTSKNYWVRVSGAGGVTVDSGTAALLGAPTIVTAPTSQFVNDGTTVNFSVSAIGAPTLAYQWKFNGTNITGATSATYALTPATLANAGSYTVTVTNAQGPVTTSAATLSVSPVGPTLGSISSTFSRTVPIGSNTELSVGIVAGTTPLTYVWRKDGVAIPNATKSTYYISNATAANNGAYSVVVTNAQGTATSANYVFNVSPELGWRWRNPLPSGNQLSTVRFINNQFLIGGLRSTMLTSPDGVAWTSRGVSGSGNIFSLVFANSLYVALGGLNAIFTSPDSINWTARDSKVQDSNSLQSLAFGAGRFVAVGYNGRTTTSTDGITWTPGSIPSTNWFSPVTYLGVGGSAKFYASSFGTANGQGQMWSSADGLTWTQVTLPSTTNDVGSLDFGSGGSFGAGLFVAADGQNLLTSTDGVTWTPQTLTGISTAGLRRVRFLNGQFILLGNAGEIRTSSDGTTWATSTISGLSTTLTTQLLDIDFNPASGRYLIVGQSNGTTFGRVLLTSTDNAATWTPSLTGVLTDPTTVQQLRGVTAGGTGGTTLVAVGNTGTILSSSDGLAWTSQSSGTTNRLDDVAFGNGAFVTVGVSGTIKVSATGATWASPTNPPATSNNLRGVKFGNAQFTAVGDGGVVATSPDGNVWTLRSTGTMQSFGTAFGAGVQVAVGNTPGIMSSADGGATWTSRNTGVATTGYSDVLFANSRFVAVGTSGLAATSTDGLTWTQAPAFTTDSLNGLSFAGGTFIAVGASSNYYVSSDGVTWTARFTGALDNMQDTVAYGNGVIMVGNNSDILAAGVPTIATQPQNTTAKAGSSATLSALAAGSPTAVTYAWTRNGTPVGANSPTLTIPVVATTDAGAYVLTATNAFGTATSASATLTVTLAPVITTQPADVTVTSGLVATFTVVASGTPTPTYQWKFTNSSNVTTNLANGTTAGTTIAGATSATLTLSNVQPAAAGTYTVVATNTISSTVFTDTSAGANLTVNVLPVVTTAPANTSVVAGGTANFSFVANPAGTPTPTYQWRLNGLNIPSATAATLALSNVPLSSNGAAITVALTNAAGTVISPAATLTVNPPLPVIPGPLSATGVRGLNFTFLTPLNGTTATFSATGLPTGLTINGTSGVISGVPTVAGPFTVNISATNTSGTGTASLTLTINPPPPVISSPIAATGTSGQSFTYNVVASNSPTSYAATGLPAGLSINTSTGAITGTPSVAGSFTVTVTATNATGSVSQSVTFTIAAPLNAPAFSGNTNLGGTQNSSTPFSFTPAFTNTVTSYALLAPTVTLSGGGGNGAVATAAVTGGVVTSITITNGGSGYTSAPTVTIGGASGTGAQATAAASGGAVTGITLNSGGSGYTLDAPTLLSQVGLAFDTATGVITGTPTSVGTFKLALQATGPGGSKTVVFTLTINPPPTAPVINSPSTATATVAAGFSFPLTTDIAATSFAATGLPSGLTLDTNTGIISGTPVAAGTSNVQVSAANGVGTGPTAVLILTVNASPSAPVISSFAVVEGQVGVAGSPLYQVVASNVPTSYQITAVTLNDAALTNDVAGAGALTTIGLSFDTNTGAVSGTPTAVWQRIVWFAATNGFGQGPSLGVLVTIKPALTVPVVTSNGTAAGQVGQPFLYAINATNGPLTAFAATNLSGAPLDGTNAPTWLTRTGSQLSGIPTTATPAGTPISIIVTATNSSGTSAPKTVTITIAPAPATPIITSSNTAGGRVGNAFTYQISASDNANSYNATNLPPGLSINPTTGVITGTPTQAGDFAVTLSAGNTAGLGNGSLLTLSIAPSLTAPSVTSAASAAGKVGVVFTYTIAASPAPITGYGLTGTLPLGLALNTSTGVISGNPAEPGTFTVQVTASGAGGTSLPQIVTIGIVPADNVPVVTSPIYALATVGSSFSYTISATNMPGSTPFPPAVTLEAVNLPAGLAVNPSTGVIQGLPSAAGVFTATLVGTNAAGTGPSRDLTIFIQPAATAPVVTSVSSAAGQVGTAFTYQITATNSPVSYEVLGAPAWMTINGQSGLLGGNPTAPGTYTVQLVASNAAGASNPLTVTLLISPAANTPIIVSSQTASGQLSTAFSYQISATLSPTAYVATGLPAGLGINGATGLISGTPTTSGTFPVTLTAVNANGSGKPVILNITITGTLTFVVPAL